MKKSLLLCFTLMFAFAFSESWAQERTVSGKVTSIEDGSPLPGVNVVLKGTTTGSVTDIDGNYKLVVPADGGTLVFSFIGLASEEVVLGSRSVIDLQMSPDVQQLSEVVVTAQGVERSKRALGYAVSTLDSKSVEQRPEADVVRSLNGKVAGVQITGTSGATGSGTNFIIRGRSSINGDNQPLFIVDGVPFDAGTNDAQGATFADGGITTASRFLDLDPNNIKSISVLRGLSASVLYGQQGRNGVVLITTKSGSGASNLDRKMEVTVDQTVYVNQIASLPDFQNEYGQGADNIFNSAFVGNWGARFSSLDNVPHPYDANFNGNFLFADVFPEFQGATVPYQPHDNAGDFFRDGIGTTTNLGISKGGENASFNFNFGYTEEEGYIPENELNRLNFGLGGNVKLSNKLSLNSSILVSRLEVETPPIAANNAPDALSVFERTLFMPRSINLKSLPFQHPVTGESVFYRTDIENPYWLLANAENIQVTDRYFLTSNLRYDINDNMFVSYRIGLDRYNEVREFRVNKGGVTNATYQQGYMRTIYNTNSIMNHTVTFNANNIELTNDLNLSAAIGAEGRRDEFNQFGQSSVGQVVFGVFNHRNFVSQTNLDPLVNQLDFIQEENILGAFFNASLDYKNALFLNVTGRNDWSSTLESANQSIFYPGVSVAWIPTATFPNFASNVLDYLKVRLGYGTSARFPNPYNTRAILNATANEFQSPQGPVTTNTAPSRSPNPDLRPELQTELELGIEGQALRNRLSWDITMYQRNSEDQIIARDLDPATGFTDVLTNLGTVQTEGIEIGLNATPVKVGNFRWDMRNIFDAYETTVTDLPVDALVYAGFTSLGNFAENNQPLGIIKGSYAMRDDEGNLLINPTTGKNLDSDDFSLPIETIGDPNPDFRITTINSFTWKGLTLSAQFEYVHGGDVYSQTTTQLLRRGVTEANLQRENTYVIPGVFADPATGEVLLDENGNKIANNIQLGSNDLYFVGLVDPGSQGIYDASHFRLREVSLSYQLPQTLLEKTPFGRASVTLSGQNLWFFTPNMPDAINFDPEQLSTGVGNAQGLEFQTGPTTRRFAASLKFTF